MSPHMPFVTGEQVEVAARNAGFRFDRKTGSHAVYLRDSDKRRIVIPMHAGKTLNPRRSRGLSEIWDLPLMSSGRCSNGESLKG